MKAGKSAIRPWLSCRYAHGRAVLYFTICGTLYQLCFIFSFQNVLFWIIEISIVLIVMEILNGVGLDHFSSLRITGLVRHTSVEWNFYHLHLFSPITAQSSRPVECDLIGWKKCKWRNCVFTPVRWCYGGNLDGLDR